MKEVFAGLAERMLTSRDSLVHSNLFLGWWRGHSYTEIFTPAGCHVSNSQIPLLVVFVQEKTNHGSFSATWLVTCLAGTSRPYFPRQRAGPTTQAPLLTSVTFPWASRTSLSPTNSSYLSHQVLAVEDARC